MTIEMTDSGVSSTVLLTEIIGLQMFLTNALVLLCEAKESVPNNTRT